MSLFVPAVKTSVPVKLALVGPAGSGKTYTALAVARGLVGPEGRIAGWDAEHGSMLEYADQFVFDHAPAEAHGDYSPHNFAVAVKSAQKDYDCLVMDGISPAWNGKGGVQEIVDKNTKGGNSWSGWAVGTPAHNELLEAILACKIHLICTMRSKTAWALEENDKGKKVPVKIGLEPVQRDGIDYEFTIVGHLGLDHSLTIYKSRRQSVPVGEIYSYPGVEFGEMVVSSGEHDVVAVDVEGFREALGEDTPTPETPPETESEVAQPTVEEKVAAEPEPSLLTPEEPAAPRAEQPKESEATKVEGVGPSLEQITAMDEVLTELQSIRPDLDWEKKIEEASVRDFKTKPIELSEENAAKLIERMKATLLDMKNKVTA